MGIDGDIIYLLRNSISEPEIIGFNLETGETEYRYVPGAFVPYGKLGKMHDGTLLARLVRPPTPNGSKVVRIISIPDEEAILDIEGPVILALPGENGVFYQLHTGEFYYCTYDGLQYRTNIGEDIPGQYLRPVAVSNSGDDVWVIDTNRVIFNYKRATSQRQKSARKTV